MVCWVCQGLTCPCMSPCCHMCRASNSAGRSSFRPFKLTMQKDGNLVGETRPFGTPLDCHSLGTLLKLSQQSGSKLKASWHRTWAFQPCKHTCWQPQKPPAEVMVVPSFL
jgi:hypothetical protein